MRHCLIDLRLRASPLALRVRRSSPLNIVLGGALACLVRVPGRILWVPPDHSRSKWGRTSRQTHWVAQIRLLTKAAHVPRRGGGWSVVETWRTAALEMREGRWPEVGLLWFHYQVPVPPLLGATLVDERSHCTATHQRPRSSWWWSFFSDKAMLVHFAAVLRKPDCTTYRPLA